MLILFIILRKYYLPNCDFYKFTSLLQVQNWVHVFVLNDTCVFQWFFSLAFHKSVSRTWGIPVFIISTFITTSRIYSPSYIILGLLHSHNHFREFSWRLNNKRQFKYLACRKSHALFSVIPRLSFYRLDLSSSVPHSSLVKQHMTIINHLNLDEKKYCVKVRNMWLGSTRVGGMSTLISRLPTGISLHGQGLLNETKPKERRTT